MFSSMSWGREPPKSLAMTKAPKRSGGLVLEAVWCVGAGGLGRCKGWETLGSQTPTKTGN